MVSLHISRLQRRSTAPQNGSSSSPTSRATSPKAMNDSTLVLRVTVAQGRNLAAKDKNGFSDPYVVLTWCDYRFQTEAQPKTLNPIWNDTFDMPLSGAHDLTLKAVCWDKDRFGKDYMGELKVALDDVFANGQIAQEPLWLPLKSSRKKGEVSGEIQLQFVLEDPHAQLRTPEEIMHQWQSFVSNLVQTPGSVGSSDTFAEVDGMEDDEEDDDDEELAGAVEGVAISGKPQKEKKRKVGIKKRKKKRPYELNGSSDVVGVIFLEINSIKDLPPERNMTRTGFDMDPFVVASLGKKTYRTRHIRHSLNPVFEEKMVFQVLRHEQNYSLNLAVVDRDKFSSNDFVAETNFPLQEIIATAPEADPTTGLYHFIDDGSSPTDMPPTPGTPGTPNTIASIASLASTSNTTNGKEGGRKFRLGISRTNSGASLAPKTRPSLTQRLSTSSLRSVAAAQSSQNHNASDSLVPQTAESIPVAPPSPSKMMPSGENIEYNLTSFTIPLPLKNKDRWEDKHKPEMYIRAKYVPYQALRQQFWRTMLRQYDSDDTGKISRVEMSTMLDTLGSTLHAETINSFFERYQNANGGGSIESIELTIDQAVIALEDQLSAVSKQPQSSAVYATSSDIPIISVDTHKDSSGETSELYDSNDSESPTPQLNSRNHSTLSLTPHPYHGSAGEEGEALNGDDLAEDDKPVEHVIQIKECPLCHQPRMNKRSEMDIVTHLATCASQDWRQVDKLVMGGFVTSSQAQRKWYSKVISKIGYGGYKLGANSANILVQDRITGMVQEERMSVYVRLGIRLLYKGLKSSSMENKKIRKLLYSLSVKQGKKYDNPASAKDIKGFIAFHQLDLNEVLKPLDQFKTFNEFFYRELKPTARPCSAPDNPKVIVSCADCRSVVFNRVDEATKLWIKGREFSIARLLGKAYPEDAKRYENGGGLAIFRLAPQDYHRFHFPVDGVMGESKLIKGEYYTVNPMAIRSALDVYGENVRVVVPIDSTHHGRVMLICVGAMMVGSTVITAKAGQQVKRTDELGYFKFGGSTIVALFEPGRMVFDDDLVENSRGALETLIRVGMSIGHTPDMAAVQERKTNVTHEDKLQARRRIEGSLAPQMEAHNN